MAKPDLHPIEVRLAVKFHEHQGERRWWVAADDVAAAAMEHADALRAKGRHDAANAVGDFAAAVTRPPDAEAEEPADVRT